MPGPSMQARVLSKAGRMLKMSHSNFHYESLHSLGTIAFNATSTTCCWPIRSHSYSQAYIRSIKYTVYTVLPRRSSRQLVVRRSWKSIHGWLRCCIQWTIQTTFSWCMPEEDDQILSKWRLHSIYDGTDLALGVLMPQTQPQIPRGYLAQKRRG